MGEVPSICASCAADGHDRPFFVTRRMERAWRPLGSLLVQAEIGRSEAVATYCMRMCRDAGVATAMRGIGVPIAKMPPGHSIPERCSICHNPVDLCDWQLVFVEEDESCVGGRCHRRHVRYLATLCSHCEGAVPAWKTQDDSTASSPASRGATNVRGADLE